MKTNIKEFESLLKAKGISKRAFAAFSQIPYDTVAGWKKSKKVPAYAMVLAHAMPSEKEYVTASELLAAGLPRAILWNNDPHKKVPSDIFIVATLQRAYNDFVIDTLAEYFGPQKVLTALLYHKERLSDELIKYVTARLTQIDKPDDRPRDPQAA